MLKKILVIDDDPDILNVLNLILKANAFQVKTSFSADHIFKLVADFNPDIILLDIMLGASDGRAVCAELKYTHATKHIPIVLLSATSQDRGSVLKWGADDFVAKPFEMDQLIHTLRSHIKV